MAKDKLNRRKEEPPALRDIFPVQQMGSFDTILRGNLTANKYSILYNVVVVAVKAKYRILVDQGRPTEPITKWKTISELVLPHSAWSGSCFNVMARPGLDLPLQSNNDVSLSSLILCFSLHAPFLGG
jgi:hypothetical protein